MHVVVHGTILIINVIFHAVITSSGTDDDFHCKRATDHMFVQKPEE